MMTDGGPPVDLDAFRKTMREGGIEEFVEEILEEYVKEAPEIFARLNTAVVARDIQAIRAQAHALKSSSLSVCARRFSAMLGEMEAAAARGHLTASIAGFQRAQPEYDAVMAYLASRSS